MARTERTRIHDREAVAEMPDWMKEKNCPHKKKYMAGKRIQPKNLNGKEKLTYIVDECFLAYNSARLKEACQLFANRMLDPDVTIGMSISGALTPAGLGCSSIIPIWNLTAPLYKWRGGVRRLRKFGDAIHITTVSKHHRFQ